MLPSILAASAVLLTLLSPIHATPQILGSATSTTLTAATSTPSSTTTACNNSPDLCARPYNNITHMGVHDAAFLRDASTGFSTSGNHFYNATDALSAGFRLIQSQVHLESGELRLCHSSCVLLNAGALVIFLAEIKIWMDANPNEVVTLLLVNSDSASASDFGSLFTSSGLNTYAYTPLSSGPQSTWPTLQAMIAANTRLVTFVAPLEPSASFPYLLPEFDFLFETAFEITSPTGFNCTLHRPSSLSSADAALGAGYLGVVNHFLGVSTALGIVIPDVSNIESTNSPDTAAVGALGSHVQQCRQEWGTVPSFVLVDFWNVGPAIEAGDALNGVSASGRTEATASPVTSDTAGRARGRRAVLLGVSAGVVVALAL